MLKELYKTVTGKIKRKYEDLDYIIWHKFEEKLYFSMIETYGPVNEECYCNWDKVDMDELFEEISAKWEERMSKKYPQWEKRDSYLL